MATKTASAGLLSKMAMFVRNPTKNWSDLEEGQAEQQDSGFDKKAIKDMIERKRQNDFIRKREFDQLRRLRSKGVATMEGVGRPSVFQNSSVSDMDGRAVTLRKIDEIEAQMSKQWWKGKQEGATVPGSGFSSDPTRPSDLDEIPRPSGSAAIFVKDQGNPDFLSTDAVAGSATTQPNQNGEFLATELGGETMDPDSQPLAVAKKRSTASHSAAAMVVPQNNSDADSNFSTSKLFAIDVEEMASDPELEEAAIRFANSDDAGAEASLLEALRRPGSTADSLTAWVSALLDMYRATHNRVGFDSAVAEFSHCFEVLEPQWEAIGSSESVDPSAPISMSGGLNTSPTDEPDYGAGAIWRCPMDLNAAAMEALRDAMESNPTPWHLDWSKVQRISEDAMPLLAGLFRSLCDEPVALRFSGAARWLEVLRETMRAGDRGVNPDWWIMRLNILRTMNLLDDFELAALDYCVTYEISPPAWQEARCQYSNVEDELAAIHAAAETVQDAATPSFEEISDATNRTGGNESSSAPELTGSVLGDAAEAFAAFDPSTHKGRQLVISCKGLVRVDFSAAGSILNWVAMRQAEGYRVQFRDVHRLVAAFFNVIGISEHARVIPRPI